MAVTGMSILDNLSAGLGRLVTVAELAAIDSEIDTIISTIKHELQHYTPEHFKHQGHVATSAWGGGERSANVAMHHTRAHEVMADTLLGVRKDLEEYQAACKEARRYLTEADLTAASDLDAIRKAVDSLSHASQANNSNTAFGNAQVAHANPAGDH
ncbi:hypothetical protein [Nocardioides montaniterrae]